MCQGLIPVPGPGSQLCKQALKLLRTPQVARAGGDSGSGTSLLFSRTRTWGTERGAVCPRSHSNHAVSSCVTASISLWLRARLPQEAPSGSTLPPSLPELSLWPPCVGPRSQILLLQEIWLPPAVSSRPSVPSPGTSAVILNWFSATSEPPEDQLFVEGTGQGGMLQNRLKKRLGLRSQRVGIKPQFLTSQLCALGQVHPLNFSFLICEMGIIPGLAAS